jgi:hypothetical protein
MVNPDDPRLVFLPETSILAASGMTHAIRNSWFSVHPERGLLFWQSLTKRKGQLRGASPQCNRNKTVTDQIAARMYPWAEIRFYPLVLQPIDVSDYQ